MAAGYARASGKVGVCVVTSGPGATNTVTPVRDCGRGLGADRRDLRPGAAPRRSAPTRSRRRRSRTSWAPSPSIASWSPTRHGSKRRCARRSRSLAPGVRGPVVIDVPKDVQNWQGAFQGSGGLPIRGYRQRMDAALRQHARRRRSSQRLPRDAGRLGTAADLCGRRRDQRRGRGTSCAHFADELGIPVVTTLMGIGASTPRIRSRCACSACTARHSPITRWTTATS